MAVLQRVACIVGPTASGKSELADILALRLGSEVISVDSMQVYRGMDIGTAKVPALKRRVALRMVDVAEPSEDYSVALFQREARGFADSLLKQGITPVFCGGTGLYLDAVIDEMEFPSGEVGSTARTKYEEFAAEHGPEVLYELLRERDAASAALIHPNNVRRVVRALELSDQGLSYASHHEGLLARSPHYDARIYAIAWPREVLYERIERRVDAMLEAGLYDEVAGLLHSGCFLAQTARQAIGYQEMIDVALGASTIDEAAELMKTRTRRYAKRQLSWLKRDGRTTWIEPPANEPFEAFCDRAAARIVAELAEAG